MRWKEFRIGDLFEKLKAPYIGTGKKQDNVSKIKTEEFSLPLINCKWGNNGIMYYGRDSDFTSYKNVLSVIYNGPPTCGKVYFQEEIGVYTDAYLINVIEKKGLSKEVYLYLMTAIESATFNTHYARNNKATWNKVQNDIIMLPVTPDGSPDFEYMEKYIGAIEKLTIKGVVEWKDKEIEKIKEIIA